MAYLARTIPAMAAARGRAEKVPQPSEQAAISAIRKGVITARDLEAGEILSRADLMFARPASEIPALEVDAVVGARVARPLAKGAILRRSDLSE